MCMCLSISGNAPKDGRAPYSGTFCKPNDLRCSRRKHEREHCCKGLTQTSRNVAECLGMNLVGQLSRGRQDLRRDSPTRFGRLLSADSLQAARNTCHPTLGFDAPTHPTLGPDGPCHSNSSPCFSLFSKIVSHTRMQAPENRPRHPHATVGNMKCKNTPSSHL